MTNKEIQDYKDKRNLDKGFNTYWNKGFDEAVTLLNKREEAINFTDSCEMLTCENCGENKQLKYCEKCYNTAFDTENQ